MLKNILNLEGAQQLSKKEQKSINGGLPRGCKRDWIDVNDVECGPSGYYLLVIAWKA